MGQHTGKLFGALTGFILAGPVGLLLGLVAGNWFDRSMMIEEGNQRYYNPNTVFWTGLSALAAKLSKADGVVTQSEINVFNQFLINSGVDTSTRKLCAEVFNKAKEDTLGYQEYARDIYRIWHYRREVLQEIFIVLLQIAYSDNVLHPNEQTLLLNIAREFGFNQHEYERLLAYVKKDDPDQIYKILGVERSASDAEIKRAYRKLVKEHHPDKLISQGVPEHVVEDAKNRMAKINDAYDRILKERA